MLPEQKRTHRKSFSLRTTTQVGISYSRVICDVRHRFDESFKKNEGVVRRLSLLHFRSTPRDFHTVNPELALRRCAPQRRCIPCVSRVTLRPRLHTRRWPAWVQCYCIRRGDQGISHVREHQPHERRRASLPALVPASRLHGGLSGSCRRFVDGSSPGGYRSVAHFPMQRVEFERSGAARLRRATLINVAY